MADVFDALTTRRCDKEPWTNEAAIHYLRGLAGTKLDGDCVAALASAPEAVASIQRIFTDTSDTAAEPA